MVVIYLIFGVYMSSIDKRIEKKKPNTDLVGNPKSLCLFQEMVAKTTSSCDREGLNLLAPAL